jgi:transposase
MPLLNAYLQYTRNKLTLEELAEFYGLTVRDMKFRISRYGDDLPKVLDVLDRIGRNAISRTEAAEELGKSARQVNALMESWKVKRPISDYLVTNEAADLKWVVRKKWAIDYIAGGVNIEDAAASAGVSSRQMRRWVSELLIKHYQMPFKDLATVPERKRSKLALEIETAEGIEYAERELVLTVARGEKTIEQIALEIVKSKKKQREKA